MPWPGAVVGLLLALCVGCERDAGTAPSSRTVRPAANSPLSPEERKTTSGEIALANLHGEIEVLERSVARSPGDLGEISVLVDRLLTRASVLGRLADYDRAAALGESAPRIAPGAGGAFLLRARTRAALHRFAAALEDLSRAGELGADPDAIETQRLEILDETGESDGDRDTRGEVAPAPDILLMGKEAARRARLGRAAEAERLFAEAQHHYDDVSPFPFAWLYLRQGLVWEELGNRDRARELFEAALVRVPGYAPAVSRLAAVEAESGRRDRAIELLRGLVATSDDPEFEGQLAALLLEAGDSAGGERLRRSAAAGFEKWLGRHPEAFAAKASRFWREVGGDPARALVLARENLAVRRTRSDLELLAAAEAALARRDPAL